MTHHFFVLTLIGIFAASAHAEVHLPSIFGDHMVLQQGVAVPVWGTAEPGEQVKVAFAGQSVSARADGKGKWKAELKAVASTDRPQDFAVTGKNSLVFKDVVVGEVWVCSGQSNMEASKRDLVSKEVGDQKLIRFFKTQKVANLLPQEDVEGSWVVCTPEAANPLLLSAVGYYFATNIQASSGAPVGMIQSAWGGTAIQPWIDLQAYEGTETYRKLAQQIVAQRAQLPERIAEYEKTAVPAWEEKHKLWSERQAAASATKTGGAGPAVPEAKPTPDPEPKRPPAPGQDQTTPTAIFGGMVNPHIPFAIKGVIWYQGESNTQNDERSREYAELMKLLVTGWRAQWGQGDFPFLWVQLPAFTTDRAWTVLRNAQLKALSVPNTGMAVALDLNPTDNLHPPDKSEVGRRLALLARRLAYSEKLVASGPVFQSMKIEGPKVRLAFSEIGGGLVLGGPPPAYQVKGKDHAPEKELVGFEVAGADGKFAAATAKIDGATVVVSSETVTAPTNVRYAWANHPQANLYNKEGLPAAPFATDDLPEFLKAKQ